jgi:hypothetical protein
MILQRRETKLAEKRPPDRPYQVWVRGSYSGTVDASNERDARAHAARIFLVALDEVTVLPPF